MITCTLGEKRYTVDYVSGRALREMEPAAKMYAKIVSISNAALKGEEIPENQQVSITNSGWEITENGNPVITCAETKLTAPRVRTSDAFMIGGLAWKVGSDGHTRLLKYGR